MCWPDHHYDYGDANDDYDDVNVDYDDVNDDNDVNDGYDGMRPFYLRPFYLPSLLPMGSR